MTNFICIGILSYLFGSLSITRASNDEIVLRVNITSKKLILDCEVPANGFQSTTTTNLYCPLTGRAPCFENCVRSCVLVRGRCLPLDELKSTTCMRRQENDRIITTYTVNARDPRNKGKWYCVHGGKESSGFIINETLTPKIVTTSAAPTTTNPPKTTTLRPRPVVVPKKPFPVLPYNPNLIPTTRTIRAGHQGQAIDIMKQLTRPDLIIALLALLALSLIINLAFCIRCILVRRYIEIQRAGQKDSPCLSACLCISRPEESKPPLKIPRDCIYEEITTVNNGVGHPRRPSTCSSTQRTFTTSLDGVGVGLAVDGRNSVLRHASIPRSRTFPVKAIGVPTHVLQQRPSYIYVAAAENGMLLEPVLTASSRVSSQLYDDVASEGLQSLAASTNAIYARVQKTSQQLHDRHAHQLQRKLQLQCQLQEQLENADQTDDVAHHRQRQQQQQQQQEYPRTLARHRSGSLPTPLAEQHDEQTPLTGSPELSTAATLNNRPSSAGTGNSTVNGETEDYEVTMRRSISPYDVCERESPRNNPRLELSKTLLQKADTLLREAGCLLD